jgi:hypothetical protein
LAVLVGAIVTLTGFLLVPLISRIGKKEEEKIHSLP